MRWFRWIKKRRKPNLIEVEYKAMKRYLSELEHIASENARKEEEARLKLILEAEEAWQAAYKQRWAKIALEEKLESERVQIEERQIRQKAIDDKRMRLQRIKEESLRASYMNSRDYLLGLETTQEILGMLGDSRD